MSTKIMGLTGGIATGKSTVARLLSDRATIIDADVLAREIVAPGEPAWREIVAAFGEEVLAKDRSLDRVRLRQIVFQNPERRRQLEAITHPQIRSAALRRIREAAAKGASFVIYDAPLLFEAKIDLWLRPVILVACEPAIQRERLRNRDLLNEDAIDRHLRAQMHMSQKRVLADFVIENNSDLETLAVAVEETWARVVAISPARYIFPLRDQPESDRPLE